MDKAWGENRYTWGDTPTQRRFTGQVEDGTIGLLFYNARYYDSYLGRFIQADTIVPNPAAPQSLNRYSYVRNNPLRFSDPTGHWYYDPGCDCLVQTDESYNEQPDTLFYVNGANSPLEMPSKAVCDALAGTSSPCRTDVIGDPARQFGLLVIAVLWEPGDWALTFNAWAHGDFHILDLAGLLLPFVSGQLDNVGDALHAADRVDGGADDILKRAFRGEQDRYLKSGEDGLSVFIGASDEQILHELEGEIRTVSRGSVLDLDLTVEKTPSHIQSLDPFHYEIRPGPRMERGQFKKRIKQIPWE